MHFSCYIKKIHPHFKILNLCLGGGGGYTFWSAISIATKPPSATGPLLSTASTSREIAAVHVYMVE